MAGSIGSLNAKLGLDASGLLSGLQNVEGRLAAFGSGFTKLGSLASSALGGLGVGMSFGALTDAIKSTIDDTGRLVDVSSKLGIGVSELEQLELAAKTSGVAAETLHGAFGKLEHKIGEAAAGNKEAIADFERLGLDWRELATQAPDETFGQVAVKIGTLDNAYSRAEAAQALFGKTGRELLPFLRDFKSEMDLAGGALGKLTDQGAQKLDAMGDAWERLKASAKSSFREILVGMAELIEHGPGGAANKPLDEQWFEAFDKSDLEKQLTLAKKFADMDHQRKIAEARGVTTDAMGRPLRGAPIQLANNTWEQQVAGLQEALDEVKAKRVEALEMDALNKELDEFDAHWQKWAEKAKLDARTPFEIMEDQIGNLQHAFDRGLIDAATFDKAANKARAEFAKVGDEVGRAFADKAAQMLAGLETPLEKFSATMEDAQLMEEKGLINADQLGQLRGKGLLDLEKGMGGLANRGDVGAMAKGSAEAASVINRFLNDAGRERDPQARVAAILEQTKIIEQKQRDLQERMADALEALGVG